MLCVGNTYNKPLHQITLQFAVCEGETFHMKGITRVVVFPANHSANVVTNKPNDTE